MAGKTIEDRIKEAEEKVKQARAKLQKLEALNQQKERKERTRRLIQVGGVMARLGVTTVEEAEALRAWVMGGSKEYKAAWERNVAPLPQEDEEKEKGGDKG